MAFKSEFETWRDEINPPPKPTIAERVARWFDRPEPQPDHFVWRDPFADAPEIV